MLGKAGSNAGSTLLTEMDGTLYNVQQGTLYAIRNGTMYRTMDLR